MVFSQKLKIYTDHKNMNRDALGSTSNRVYRWRLLLKEYGTEILYTKGIDNTVAGTISRLDYNPELYRHVDNEKISEETKWNNFLTLLNSLTGKGAYTRHLKKSLCRAWYSHSPIRART